MTRRILWCGLAVLAAGVGVWAEEKEKAKPAAKAEAAAETHAGFEKLKKLAGTWVEADKDGKPTDTVVSVIKLTGAGSVVHETLFPGQPHEMVSVYHLDKGELVMTHYCALGNQPKMKADPKSAKDEITWVFVGGTNLDPAKDKHMHGGTLKFVDDDHIEFSGEAWEDGKPSKDHCGTMKLVRKK
jgi:hypothetical protein